ncbi:ABC transporter permease [Peijinzhouia sedimentorum]
MPQPHPPKLPLRFFRWFCHPDLMDSIEGDLMELYSERLREIGKRKADAKFSKDVLLLLRPGIIRPIKGFENLTINTMYRSNFKIAWRNITGKKLYTIINVTGLALGIACALLIFAFVSYHSAFDDFHHNPDRIYRFVTDEHQDMIDYSGSVPPGFGNAFKEDYTYGEKIARILSHTDELITIEKDGQTSKYLEAIAVADPELFDIFNFPMLEGSHENALKEPNTVILSDRIAKKFFGDDSPIGKVIRYDNKIDLKVTGILQNIPSNTNFYSEIYFSYSTMKEINEWIASDTWGGITDNLQTFVRLRPGVSPSDVEKVLPEYVKKFRPTNKNVHHYKLQPLAEVHYDPRYGGTMDNTTIWLLSVIGGLLVFTACLNFINLATAQAVTRAKEVGVRKALGSTRGQLFWQFTTETGLIVLFAMILATTTAFLVLPYINTFFNTQISIELFENFQVPIFLLLLFLTVTLMAGAYPGIVLSGFKAVSALKGSTKGQQGNSFNIRRGLVITQFSISQVLLIALLVMISQMKYFTQTDMGFNSDGIVMIDVGSNDQKMNTLKEQFLALPQVQSVSLCLSTPASSSHWTTSLIYNNNTEAEAFGISVKNADENYLQTFDIELLAGRNVTPSDTARDFLVNEMVLTKLGITDPNEILGNHIAVNGGRWKGQIVGVVSDFHEQSFHSEIKPIFITTAKETYNGFAVKINTADLSSTLTALEKTWSTMYPDQLYQYEFLDDHIAKFYEQEQMIMTLIQYFSIIALFIGGMGLYGLASFMAVQKTKEIGIRKVLGSDMFQILWIFGKEFSRLVLYAFLIAAPVGWVLMSRWLTGFAYQIELGIWVFALELAIILVVVLLTIGYRSVKAAMANPATSLRSE